MIVGASGRRTPTGTGLVVLFVCLFLLAGCYRTQEAGLGGTGATPAELRPGYREIYLDLVARAYEADPTLDLEMMLGPGWTDEELGATLQAMLDKTPRSEAGRITRLQNLAEALDVGLVSSDGGEGGGGGAFNLADAPFVRGLVLLLVFLVCPILLIVIVAARIRRSRSTQEVSSRYRRIVEPATWEGEPDRPLVQFVTTYAHGDDRYDPSLSIESETGEFLGECGVGVAHATAGDGAERATAFEVWLFDINDIHTVTKVLVSDHAYGDEAFRAELASKGELVLARPGQVIELGTATLRARARVVERSYLAHKLAADRFFGRLTVELAVWQVGGK